MARFNVERVQGYTIMSNYHLRDNRLSMKAKGLMSVMLSLPPEWDYSLRGLTAICRECQSSIAAMVRELEECGYIERYQERGADGKLGGCVYNIYEKPKTGSPSAEKQHTVKPQTEKPCAEKQPQLNTYQLTTNPFPMSIYDNIAYGPRIHGIKSRVRLDEIVEDSLKKAALWEECKDRLKKSALGMSGGQQQRLCIARALAVEPDILLMDEPTSALDPISTSRIEDLAVELRKKYTIIMVTHNMQQAARISDKTAFFLMGEIVEFNETDRVFSSPDDKRTEDYISGRFG